MRNAGQAGHREEHQAVPPVSEGVRRLPFVAALGRQGIPVLMYHRLTRDSEAERNPYSVPRDVFSLHLRMLTSHSYRALSVADYLGEGGSSLRQSVLITFDDGHASDYEVALPLLQERGLHAVFFVTTDWMDTAGYLKRNEVRKLQQAGMSVQSHCRSHSYLDDLPAARVREELETSKSVIEDITGARVDCLSFPGGRYTSRALDLARECGYRAAFTSQPYVFRRRGQFFIAGREGVKDSLTGRGFLETIEAKLPTRVRWQLSYGARLLLRKAIGNKAYGSLWRRAHGVFRGNGGL